MHVMISPERLFSIRGGRYTEKEAKSIFLLYWEWRMLEAEKMEWRTGRVENTRFKSVCHINHRTQI